MSKYFVLVVVMIGLSLLAVAMPASADPAYCPKKTYLVIWEPAVDQFGPVNGDVVRDAVTGNNYQGYTLDRYTDSEMHDTSEDECLRTAWNALSDKAGILYFDGHGEMNVLAAVHFAHSGEGQAAAYDWVDSDPNMTVDFDEERNAYEVDVAAQWFINNWMADNNSNRAIVFLASCNSASLLDDCGGRIRFGYSGTINYPDATRDTMYLFNRLNGTLPENNQGSLRTVGDAYAAGEFSVNFTKDGDTDTTLCPAPESVHPEGEGAGISGTGWIEFDSHCDTLPSASSILTFTILKGSVTISNVRWDTNSDTTIKFDYVANGCAPDYKVKVTADASFVVSEGGADLRLDGDKIAPNWDDTEWTFED